MDGTPLHQNLTDRQAQILRMVARGHTNTEIAEELGISLNGVKWHIREMFAKYGVDTREELSDAWQDSRRPANRVRGWVRGLAFGLPFGLPLKVTAGGAAAAVVLGVAAGTVLAVMDLNLTPSAEAGKKEAKATATPSPMPTGTPVIDVPVVIVPAGTSVILDDDWISREGYVELLDQMEQVLSRSGLGQESTRGAYTIHDLEVQRAEYFPGVQGEFELGDADHYLPASEDGEPRDLFQVQWRVRDVQLLTRRGVADFVLTAVFEAGRPEAAWWHYRFGNSYDATLNSRNLEQIIAQGPSDLAVGEPVHLAFRNNAAGTGWSLEGALREDGALCIYQISGDLRVTHCGLGGIDEPIQVLNLGARYAADSSVTDRSIAVLTAPEITSIQVVSDAFEPRTYQTQLIPDGLPFDGRVAYITLLPSPRSFVVIGYNETGEEVARKGSWP